MKSYFLIVTLFITTLVCSQDLKVVDRIVFSYPKIESIEELSQKIDYDFKTDIEKVRAVFSWVVYNVEYDVSQLKFLEPQEFVVYFNKFDIKRNEERKKRLLAEKTFNRKMGICSGMAYLFKEVCDNIGIENKLIKGYVKASANEVGVIPKNKNHVWNTVKVNNRWVMIDVTYGGGEIINGISQEFFNDEYFDFNLARVKNTHFPAEYRWQEYFGQKTLTEFCNFPFVKEGFYENKITLISPRNGKLTYDKNKKRIKLEFLSKEDIESVKYIFDNDMNVKNASFKKKKNNIKAYMDWPRYSTTLHVYVNNTLSLQFKIIKG